LFLRDEKTILNSRNNKIIFSAHEKADFFLVFSNTIYLALNSKLNTVPVHKITKYMKSPKLVLCQEETKFFYYTPFSFCFFVTETQRFIISYILFLIFNIEKDNQIH